MQKWIRDKFDRVTKGKLQEISPSVEAGLALFGGSAVVLEATHIIDPTATEKELKIKGLITSAWLAGVCAVHGALINEGISHPSPTKIGLAVGAIGGTLGAGKLLFSRNNSEVELEKLQTVISDVDSKRNFTSTKVNSHSEEAEKGLALEQNIWLKSNYGDELGVYEKFVDQSHVYVAKTDDEIVGITRIFEGSPYATAFYESRILQ